MVRSDGRLPEDGALGVSVEDVAVMGVSIESRRDGECSEQVVSTIRCAFVPPDTWKCRDSSSVDDSFSILQASSCSSLMVMSGVFDAVKLDTPCSVFNLRSCWCCCGPGCGP